MTSRDARSSTADCGPTDTCAIVNASVCQNDLFGFCLQYQLNYVNACVTGMHGNGPVGTPCTDYTPCRSGLCHLTVNACTDTCARDSDCPSTHRCKIIEYGSAPDTGESIWLNVCAPLGF